MGGLGVNGSMHKKITKVSRLRKCDDYKCTVCYLVPMQQWFPRTQASDSSIFSIVPSEVVILMEKGKKLLNV